MYVYFISQMRIHLSYWGTHKKWCMEIGFYIFYICSLKHTFDIRVFIMYLKNLRKPAEIRHFLTHRFITVNPYVAGSSPAARATIYRRFLRFFFTFATATCSGIKGTQMSYFDKKVHICTRKKTSKKTHQHQAHKGFERFYYDLCDTRTTYMYFFVYIF